MSATRIKALGANIDPQTREYIDLSIAQAVDNLQMNIGHARTTANQAAEQADSVNNKFLELRDDLAAQGRTALTRAKMVALMQKEGLYDE